MTVVTFTTDFGTVDGYVGAMKGVVLSLAPDAVLVDITHDIPRHDVAAGAFALAQAAPLYPPGTVHVAVVDPGVGGERADIVVEAGGAYFVGPDNGVLALAARGPRVAHRDCRARTSGALRSARPSTGATCSPRRRARSPAAACRATPGRCWTAIEELPGVRLAEGEQDAAVVVHVDAFGNLITSWPGDGAQRRRAGGWSAWARRRPPQLRGAGGSHLRRRGAGRAAGLRGQRRLRGDRRARGFGGGGHRAGAGRSAAAREGAVSRAGRACWRAGCRWLACWRGCGVGDGVGAAAGTLYVLECTPG